MATITNTTIVVTNAVASSGGSGLVQGKLSLPFGSQEVKIIEFADLNVIEGTGGLMLTFTNDDAYALVMAYVDVNTFVSAISLLESGVVVSVGAGNLSVKNLNPAGLMNITSTWLT